MMTLTTRHNVIPKQAKNTDELPLLLLVEDSPTTTALLSKYFSGNYRLLQDRKSVV